MKCYISITFFSQFYMSLFSKEDSKAQIEELINSFKQGNLEGFTEALGEKNNQDKDQNSKDTKYMFGGRSDFFTNENFGLGDMFNDDRNIEKPQKNFDFNDKEPQVPGKDVILGLIDKYNDNLKYRIQLKNLNFFKWIKCYSIITNSQVRNIDLALGKLKSFSFDSKNTLCEIKEVSIIDCIQILDVIDINLKKKKIILTKNENFSSDNVDNIINDYFFKTGDIIFCSFKNKEENEKNFIRMCLKEIQKII